MPCVAHLDDPAVDEFDGADIDAARRLADDQHVGSALHLARQHDLLLVAAGEIGGLQPRIRRADIVFLRCCSIGILADRIDDRGRRRCR